MINQYELNKCYFLFWFQQSYVFNPSTIFQQLFKSAKPVQTKMLANFLQSLQVNSSRVQQEHMPGLYQNQEVQVQLQQPTIKHQYPAEDLIINVFQYAHQKAEEQTQNLMNAQININSVLNLGAFLHTTKKQNQRNEIQNLRNEVCRLNHQIDEGKYRQRMLIDEFQQQISNLKQQLNRKQELIKALKEETQQKKCKACKNALKNDLEANYLKYQENGIKNQLPGKANKNSMTKSSSTERQEIIQEQVVQVIYEKKKGSSINNLSQIIKKIKDGKETHNNSQQKTQKFKRQSKISSFLNKQTYQSL